MDPERYENIELPNEIKETLPEIKRELERLLVEAIKKTVPKNKKFGILFSGGIDSTLIAFICKKLGYEFTCYTANFVAASLKEPEDLVWAEKVSKELGFELRKSNLNMDGVKAAVKQVTNIIETANVVKVGVALPLYFAMKQAKDDKIKTVFSGLGSEEIFAGYERHRNSKDINQECVKGLKAIYERDLSRDLALAKDLGQEIKLPFLDISLVKYALSIPAKYKINDTNCKLILRMVAEDMGLPKEFAYRKKRAAQYGSNFDRAIARLAKRNGFKYKFDFIKSQMPNIAVLFSSGKDSCFALQTMINRGFKVNCLITLRSKNPDSYMFHTPNIHMAELQAKAMEIPLIMAETAGKKEKELDDLKEALFIAKEKYKIEGVATGALFSNYQRERIEIIGDSLGLKVYSPLWHMDQEKEMRAILDAGYELIFSSIAAEGLDESWLGAKITQKHVDSLRLLNKKLGVNIAGEGGEFESLVLDAPMFKKKLAITDSEVVEENENTARLVVKKAELKDKY